MGLYTLDDLPPEAVRDAAVLVRVDFNVPMDDGRILDATRIDEALPTLRELLERRGRLVLMSHCGRPKGQEDPRYSLRPVAEALESKLGQPVEFIARCAGESTRRTVSRLAPGQVALLENVRFEAGEEGNDDAFAAQLASLADTYVDDAFGSVHRAHASVATVPRHCRHRAAGRLLVREVRALGRLLEAPEKPFAALVGGAKIEGKIDTLRNLMDRLDMLLVGGAMANTFLTARGHDLASSKVERGCLDLAREILARAKERAVEVSLPVDLVVEHESSQAVETVEVDRVPAESVAYDVGPRTREAFQNTLSRARTVFWNGPMGRFEREPFDAGSREIAGAVATCPGFSVLGGGETVAVARQSGVIRQVDHVSTGGGASLEFLAGKKLPGIVPLEKSADG